MIVVNAGGGDARIQADSRFQRQRLTQSFACIMKSWMPVLERNFPSIGLPPQPDDPTSRSDTATGGRVSLEGELTPPSTRSSS